MSALKIISNKTPRDFIYWYDLSEKEKRDFDYLKTEDEQMSASFFRYRGNVYDAAEFMRVGSNGELKGWDGYSSDTYFSGVLVKFIWDQVVVGRYYSVG